MDLSDVVYRHVGSLFFFNSGPSVMGGSREKVWYLDRHKQPSGLHQPHRSCSVQVTALETQSEAKYILCSAHGNMEAGLASALDTPAPRRCSSSLVLLGFDASLNRNVGFCRPPGVCHCDYISVLTSPAIHIPYQ